MHQPVKDAVSKGKAREEMLGEMPPLHLIDSLGEKVGLALEKGDPSENEVPVVGIVLVPGFVEVQDVHAAGL